MQGFRLTINLKDKTCRWHGMEAGKTTLVELNPRQRVVMLHVAGCSYWSGLGDRSYAPAELVGYHLTNLSGVGENSVEVCLGPQLFCFRPRQKDWPGSPDQLSDNVVHIYHEQLEKIGEVDPEKLKA